jgi:hypothetical protein
MTTTNQIKYSTITVPAYAQFQDERLYEGRCGDLTSGLCRTVEEAQSRIELLVAGQQPRTQAPNYQANEREMAAAWDRVQTTGIRDGGYCHAAVKAAMEAGIHTAAWAIASRYLVARWI